MKTVFVDERLPLTMENRLRELGFAVIKLPADERLPKPLSSHTDMLIFRHGKRIIMNKAYARQNASVIHSIEKALPDCRITLSDDTVGNSYPKDAVMNALTVGEYLFCKVDTVSPAIKEYAKVAGLDVINVRQGYPACTVLPIGNAAAVTSDAGMARALSVKGIRVLLVEESESIKLPPYKNGFIGGAAGVFQGTIYLAGDINALPYKERLEGFAKEHGYTVVSLGVGCGELFDVGGLAFCE